MGDGSLGGTCKDSPLQEQLPGRAAFFPLMTQECVRGSMNLASPHVQWAADEAGGQGAAPGCRDPSCGPRWTPEPLGAEGHLTPPDVTNSKCQKGGFSNQGGTLSLPTRG